MNLKDVKRKTDRLNKIIAAFDAELKATYNDKFVVIPDGMKYAGRVAKISHIHFNGKYVVCLFNPVNLKNHNEVIHNDDCFCFRDFSQVSTFIDEKDVSEYIKNQTKK